MTKSRVRKTTNDAIDAESIARYLMIREEKETFVIPDNFRNLREFIRVYCIVTDKIRTSKNNLISALDIIFPRLSNVVDINADTVDRAPYLDVSSTLRFRKGLDRVTIPSLLSSSVSLDI